MAAFEVFLSGTRIPTKAQLRVERRHKLDGWLSGRGWRLDESRWWTSEQVAAEEAAFAEFDAEYEAAKAQLRETLLSLSETDLNAYFAAIGWTASGSTPAEQVDDYLANG